MAAQLIPIMLFTPVMMGLAYLRTLDAEEIRHRAYQAQRQRIRVRLEIAERAADRLMRNAA